MPMKLKSLVSLLTVTALAVGAAALLSSCQSTGPHRNPGQVMQDTHRKNVERHRAFHNKMADRHEEAFGFRPPSPPGMHRGY